MHPGLPVRTAHLRWWMDRCDVGAGRKEGLTRVQRREPLGLRRRTRVLEMENEILKRAGACVARENVLPQ